MKSKGYVFTPACSRWSCLQEQMLMAFIPVRSWHRLSDICRKIGCSGSWEGLWCQHSSTCNQRRPHLGWGILPLEAHLLLQGQLLLQNMLWCNFCSKHEQTNMYKQCQSAGNMFTYLMTLATCLLHYWPKSPPEWSWRFFLNIYVGIRGRKK